MLAFGPDDLLYIGMGDGGADDDPAERAQNLDSLLGKMLRIDPRNPAGSATYRIPNDNPFVGHVGPGRDLVLWLAQPVALLVRP